MKLSLQRKTRVSATAYARIFTPLVALGETVWAYTYGSQKFGMRWGPATLG